MIVFVDGPGVPDFQSSVRELESRVLIRVVPAGRKRQEVVIVAGGLPFDDIIRHAAMRGGHARQARLAAGGRERVGGVGGRKDIAMGGRFGSLGGIQAGDVSRVAEIGWGEGRTGRGVGEGPGILKKRIGAGEASVFARVGRKRIAGRRPPRGVHLHVGIHGGGPRQATFGVKRRGIGSGGGGGVEQLGKRTGIIRRREGGPGKDRGVRRATRDR